MPGWHGARANRCERRRSRREFRSHTWSRTRTAPPGPTSASSGSSPKATSTRSSPPGSVSIRPRQTQVPHVSVEPATALRDEQNVAVHGAGFIPDADASVEECVARAPEPRRLPVPHERGHRSRRHASKPRSRSGGGSGSTTAPSTGVSPARHRLPVRSGRRRPRVRCVRPTATGAAVTVEPHVGLVDRQVVDVEMHGAEAGSFVELQLCAVGGTMCRGSVSKIGRRYGGNDPMALPQVRHDGADCAVTRASATSASTAPTGTRSRCPSRSIRMPRWPAAAAPRGAREGLWDRERVEVRGERLDPGTRRYAGMHRRRRPPRAAARRERCAVDSRGSSPAGSRCGAARRRPDGGDSAGRMLPRRRR